MESWNQDDQEYREFTWEEDHDRTRCEKDYASQEMPQDVKVFIEHIKSYIFVVWKNVSFMTHIPCLQDKK